MRPFCFTTTEDNKSTEIYLEGNRDIFPRLFSNYSMSCYRCSSHHWFYPLLDSWNVSFLNFTMQQLKNLILNLIHFVCNNRGCIVLISSWSVDKEMWIQGRHKCALRTVFNRIQVHKWTCWIQGRHKCALRTVFALIAIINCLTSYL